MDLTREQELKIFRGVNGDKKIWDTREGRISYMNSREEKDLRYNQSFAKSKLVRYVSNNNIDLNYWLGEGVVK